MKFNFLGDSITAGAGAGGKENMYTYLVSECFQAEERNFGVGGTRIAKQVRRTLNPDDDVFMCRAVRLDQDADFTFVFGGTNDYGHGDAKMGSFEDRDEYTFYGAMHQLTSYLVDTFGKKLCFILPIPRYDQSNVMGDGSKTEPSGTLNDYIEAEKEVLRFYGVEFLDLSDRFPEPEAPCEDELTVDGLHPNAKGNRLLADALIEYLKSKGFAC